MFLEQHSRQIDKRRLLFLVVPRTDFLLIEPVRATISLTSVLVIDDVVLGDIKAVACRYISSASARRTLSIVLVPSIPFPIRSELT